jgi:hypothetical protein
MLKRWSLPRNTHDDLTSVPADSVEMSGVREYKRGDAVYLGDWNGRLCVLAQNVRAKGGNVITAVDLLDLLVRLRANRLVLGVEMSGVAAVHLGDWKGWLSKEPRTCVFGLTESEDIATAVDLLDLLGWLHANRPELVKDVEAETVRETYASKLESAVTPVLDRMMCQGARVDLDELDRLAVGKI